MFGSLRELAHTLLSFVETRARLAATELEEQGVRLTEIFVLILVALFFFGLALVFAAILIVLLFWDSNRLLAAGLLGTLFLGAGATAAFIARARMRERPRFLAATLSELEQDRQRIGRP